MGIYQHKFKIKPYHDVMIIDTKIKSSDDFYESEEFDKDNLVLAIALQSKKHKRI